MALPSALRIRRRQPDAQPGCFASASSKEARQAGYTRDELHRATRARKIVSTTASVFYLLACIFLLLVVIGSTHNQVVLRDIYFFRLNLANIIPQSVANATLINSIARSLGLHDFYQVGLWSFCEGYNDEGVTYCSPPEVLYWFNPVEVLMNELLAGATIALPNEVMDILNILRIASQVMFGFFLAGTLLVFALMVLSPVVLYSRWWSLPLAAVSGVAALLVGAASIVATVISFAFQYAATSQSDLNIGASVGVPMFAFMWLGAAFAGLSSIMHSGLGCCGTSRRDIRTGRRQIGERNHSPGDHAEQTGSAEHARHGTPQSVSSSVTAAAPVGEEG